MQPVDLSGPAAGNNLTITADTGDVNLIPGRESYSSEYTKKSTSVGHWNFFGESGIGSFTGLRMEEQGVKRTGDYTAGSLASAGRDLSIEAGRNLNQVGSHLEAGRDVLVDVGQDWNMTASADYESLHQYVKQIEIGLTGTARQNVSGAVRTLIDLPEDMQAGRGGAGYSAVTAASAGLRAVDAVRSATSQPVSISGSAGVSYSRTDYSASSTTAVPSSVVAGRDVEAYAGRDITIEGGAVVGGRDVILDAGRDLNVIAAQNSGKSSFSSESGGGSVGVKAVVGSGGMSYGINVAAQAAGSGSRENYTTNSNALIVAGDVLSASSGRDTTVAGAHLEGDRVWMDVGRDLTVASVQDSYDSKSHSWNAGVDVTIGYGVHVAGDFGIGQGKSSSDWVGGQTSIVGRKEADIYVEDNTHIKGAIIATDKGGDLTLNTDTLTFEQIKDKDKGENWHLGVSGGFSIGGAGFDQGKEGDLIKPIDYTNGGSAPYVPDSVEGQYSAHDRRGVLRPTVTEGEIVVRSNPDAATDGSLAGLNRELDRAREITKDEKINVDVYISPGAVAEVVSGFGGITGDLAAYGKMIEAAVEKVFPGEQAGLINQAREEAF